MPFTPTRSSLLLRSSVVSARNQKELRLKYAVITNKRQLAQLRHAGRSILQDYLETLWVARISIFTRWCTVVPSSFRNGRIARTTHLNFVKKRSAFGKKQAWGFNVLEDKHMEHVGVSCRQEHFMENWLRLISIGNSGGSGAHETESMKQRLGDLERNRGRSRSPQGPRYNWRGRVAPPQPPLAPAVPSHPSSIRDKKRQRKKANVTAQLLRRPRRMHQLERLPITSCAPA